MTALAKAEKTLAGHDSGQPVPLVTSRRVTLAESHLPIIRRALVDGVDPLLVVEDDLDFPPDVGGRGPA